MFNLKGEVHLVGETTKISDKFTKRDLVVKDESGQYPQFIAFQVTQDRCSLLDSVKVGDNVNVLFNLRGREWTSPSGEVKYFNTLEAWKIEDGGAVSKQAPVIPDVSNLNTTDADEDDLPF